ncbi:hypothetical protein [Nocardia sp. NPDC052566]|uniref:hypothetical protein n=1 Tax=Nocardia sp. NPDC052566 TaxID=3364330 RepID=UPI0037C8157B
MDGFGEMCRVFDKYGLGEPPVPERFRSRLVRVDKCAYATRLISPFEMYMFDYPNPAMRSWVPDYVAVSHAGHGVNSYAITYHLVSGPLILFAQTLYGGVYEDNELAAQQVRRMFQACAPLAEAAESAPNCGTHRLLVMHSVFRGATFRKWLTFPGPRTPCPAYTELVALRDDPFHATKTATRILQGHR